VDKSKVLELALTAWIHKIKSLPASLRGRKHVRPNFEELFQQWKDLDGSFDDTYETLLPKAIKAHLANPSKIRDVYKTLKSKMDKTEKEFADEWNQSIESAAHDVYFEFFPAVPLDKDDEPKVYGNMSATEYRAQRRYAEQFPILDTTELVKAWREQKQYNPEVDDKLENILGGKSDETNS
jgi:hypothetical protein